MDLTKQHGERGKRRQSAPAPLDVSRRPGQPLDAATRAWFEPRFRHDFGRVRVHHDADAHASSRALGARGYALGVDIVVGDADFAPHSAEGRALLAHELAHVAQQEPGEGRLGASSSVDQAEADAEAAAEGVLAGRVSPVRVVAPSGVPLRSVEDGFRRERGRVRTGLTPDVGLGRGRLAGGGDGAGASVDAAETEAMLRVEIEYLRPTIPAWDDTEAMSGFDSAFFGDDRIFLFRGREMLGWEVNYYFISMALAHQGWDWNETQSIIWTWNKIQDLPFVEGEGLTTDEMWFAAYQGFSEEQVRMALDAVLPVGHGAPTSGAPAP